MTRGTSRSPGTVVLASRNAKKLAELRRVLQPLLPRIEVLGLDEVDDYDEPAETESTFEGNALIKARACWQVSGLPSVADDSGICVDALNGMPGVLSARLSGKSDARSRAETDAANNALLLAQLADVPDERRSAQFVCAVALVGPDGTELVERGTMPGRILRAEQGEGGFGYDPLFVADGNSVSNAELLPEQKDAISHRGKALRALVPHLRTLAT
ncbi:MAG TPA: RdgB/HAM1 family non-canonical purine NTP pyrophosphatase [Aeromicrobium sp.]|nr:RdgB/HAM1 family non-canonical purine NTP pyrophosphatase [Aeromicrobium sp.]